MEASGISKIDELLAQKAAIMKKHDDQIAEIKERKKRRTASLEKTIRLALIAANAERKRADNHAKVLAGVGAIFLAQKDPQFRAMLERGLRECYAKTPNNLSEATRALGLTVVAPEADGKTA